MDKKASPTQGDYRNLQALSFAEVKKESVEFVLLKEYKFVRPTDTESPESALYLVLQGDYLEELGYTPVFLPGRRSVFQADRKLLIQLANDILRLFPSSVSNT